jgi:transcriptional regulator with XRE-family HTH domain
MHGSTPPPDTIGARLRARRKELGLTLKQVAAETGLSIGFISQVERDAAVPSLSSMVALSRTLKANLTNFITQPTVDGDLNRQEGRPIYALGSGARTYERISSSFAGSKIRSLLIHEPPGHRGVPMVHQGEEILVYMLTGSVTVELDGIASILQAGDSLHFPSSKVHMIWNHTDQPATFLWVGTIDVFGDGSTAPP